MLSLHSRLPLTVVALAFVSGFGSGCSAEAPATLEDQSDATLSTDELPSQSSRHHHRGFDVLKPRGKYFGKRYDEWGSAWWRWALETPASTNAVIDTTGEFCGVNQKQPLFFLAGDLGGTVERTCTIPRGKPVFFPLLNFFWDNCGVPPAEQTPHSDIIAELEKFSDSVTALSVTVDGHSIGSDPAALEPYLSDVTRFSYVVPDEDSFYDYIGFDFAGRCAPSFQTGYYVMIDFERGHHEIEFSGTQGEFSLDVKYSLTVK